MSSIERNPTEALIERERVQQQSSAEPIAKQIKELFKSIASLMRELTKLNIEARELKKEIADLDANEGDSPEVLAAKAKKKEQLTGQLQALLIEQQRVRDNLKTMNEKKTELEDKLDEAQKKDLNRMQAELREKIAESTDLSKEIMEEIDGNAYWNRLADKKNSEFKHLVARLTDLMLNESLRGVFGVWLGVGFSESYGRDTAQAATNYAYANLEVPPVF